jgi:hypothetical protein
MIKPIQKRSLGARNTSNTVQKRKIDRILSIFLVVLLVVMIVAFVVLNLFAIAFWVGVCGFVLAVVHRPSRVKCWKYLIGVSLLLVVWVFASPIMYASVQFFGVNGKVKTCQEISSTAYRTQLADYARNILNDSIDGLNYRQLLDWELRHLKWGAFTYRSSSLEILKIGSGSCGDYALVYYGLLVANNYTARLVVDCSWSYNPLQSAGNHAWDEVMLSGRWVHVDPSDNRTDDPQMYARDWEKEINLVYAIDATGVVNVAESYQLATPMNEVDNTSALLGLTGAVITLLGAVLTYFVFKPLIALRRTITNIEKTLNFYAGEITNRMKNDVASEKVRNLACRLPAQTKNVSGYALLAYLEIMPPKTNMEEAEEELIRMSNYLGNPNLIKGSVWNPYCIEQVIYLLGRGPKPQESTLYIC